MRYPGPRSAEVLAELGRTVVATPYPFVLDLERCDGMWLATIDGQRLFDWAGYFGSKLIGHNHPRLSEPEYLVRLARAANNKVANPDFPTVECVEYYRMIHRLSPERMRGPNLEVYAVNSGAEAVENVLKYLVSRFNAKAAKAGRPIGNRRFLYFDQAFHGRTVYALQVTQTVDPVGTKDFHGLSASGNIKIPFPAIDTDATDVENARRTDDALRVVESILTHMADEVVAILVEPIQGAGGQRVAEPRFFQELSELAHRYGVYLAFDEVQTSLGATGRLFAIDHFDLPHPPQAVAAGKKFGCGVVYMEEPLEDIGVLDSTWGGTLADMVRVVREVEVVEEEGLIARAERNGARLAEGLRRIAHSPGSRIRNVRGIGLYQGFSLPDAEQKARFIERAREEEDCLVLGAGVDSIRTRPNLSVTANDIDRFLEIVERLAIR
ncbi:MAG: aminotransferase class III-fold pyridoxal phosphate-dependent enzyme [Armatimonadota bacterium]